MTAARTVAAVALGVYLGSTPFLRHSGLGHAAFPHRNHQPRHGGQLAMVGDFHIELVRSGDRLEAFVSDASRRPVQPHAGHVSFGGGERQDLAWQQYRLVGADSPASASAEVGIVVTGGEELRVAFERQPAPSR